jgi:hypothetical protein
MIVIKPLTLPEVRAAWGWVRNGLLEIIGRCHERWAPEDAWTAIMAGNAHVWTITTASDEIGFLILRKIDDPDGPVLFIWALWTEPNAILRKLPDLHERLIELCHRMGAKRIRMESPRKGWCVLEKLNFTERSVNYEYEI